MPTGRGISRARTVLAGTLLVLTFVMAWAQPASATPVGQIDEFSSGIGPGPLLRGIVAGDDGNLWFVDDGTPTKAIGRVDTSGNIHEFLLPSGTAPKDVAAAAGYVWFTDDGSTKAIGRIKVSSGHVDEFTTGLSGTSHPTAIAAGPDGNLWFTDRGTTKAIGRLDPHTGAINEYTAGLLAGTDPRGIARGPDGNMWFGDTGSKSVGRIIPSTHQIDEFTSGLNPGSAPIWVAPGPDGKVWFTDNGATKAIGSTDPATGQSQELSAPLTAGATPLALVTGQDGNLWFADFHGDIGQVIVATGQILEYPVAGGLPVGIWPGSDGNVWFADGVGKIGRVGTGAPPALRTAPSVAGSHRAGDPQTCTGAQWSTWAGVTPLVTGYVWYRSGTVIAGQNSQTYTPSSGDVGQPIACQEVSRYDLPLLIPVSATSASTGVRAPKLSALKVSPRRFARTGRRVHGRCVARTTKNSGNAHCRRPLKLTIRFKLAAESKVIFTLKRVLGSGRKVKGRCVKTTKKNRKHKKCKRLSSVKGARITVRGHIGGNKLTVKGKFGGRGLRPGSYELVGTPRVNGRDGTAGAFIFRVSG